MKQTEVMGKTWSRVIVTMMIFGAALIVFDVTIVCFGVFARYFFNFTQVELFEIVEYSLLWMTFLGTTWLLKEKGHVTVELVVSRLSQKKQKIVELVVLTITAILFFILLIYSAKVFWHDLVTNYRLAGVLRPPKWIIELVIPLGFFFMLIHMIGELITRLLTFRGQRQGRRR